MHTAPNQRLLEWIRQFRADLTPEGTITRLELFHSVDGGLGERLATFEMADRDEDEDPDDLVQEIWDQTEEDAATRPTGAIERYVVLAFRGDTREPDAQKAFTNTGKLMTGLIGNGTEPPTARGEMAAEMRRTNDLHALVVRMCEATAGSAAIQLQREREENQRLREVGFKYEQLRQDLLDRSLDRDLARKDAEANATQMGMLFQTLMQIAPVVLSKLLASPSPAGAALPLQPAAPAPRPVAPAAHPSAAPSAQASPADPRTVGPTGTPAAPAPEPMPPVASVPIAPPILERDHAVASLLGSVNPEQLRVLMSTFSEEQTRSFLSIYTSFREHPPQPVRQGSVSSN